MQAYGRIDCHMDAWSERAEKAWQWEPIISSQNKQIHTGNLYDGGGESAKKGI